MEINSTIQGWCVPCQSFYVIDQMCGDGSGLSEERPCTDESAHPLVESSTVKKRACSLRWVALYCSVLFVGLAIACLVFSGWGIGPSIAPRAAADLPLLGLGHLSPETTNQVLCVTDIDQIVSRIILLSSAIDRAAGDCDFEGIRKNKGLGNLTSLDREICASTILVIMLNANLVTGLLTASISTCTGALNVPANCGTNIAAFIGGTSILLQSIVAVDINCVQLENRPIQTKIDVALARAKREKDKAIRSAQKFVKNAGFEVDVLPAPPAVPTKTVYSATALCFAFINLGLSQVMKLGIILADSSIHCTRQANSRQPRVCAIDILGILILCSAITRVFALAANQCVRIVGDTNPSTRCLQASAGVSAGALAVTARSLNLRAACQVAFTDWHPHEWLEKALGEGHENVHSGIPDRLDEDLTVPAEDGNVIIPDE